MSLSPFIARSISKTYADRDVFHDLSFTASAGQRIGLVGENGIGKSTLLRLLSGTESPDGGEIHRPAEVGYLAQELPFSMDSTVHDVLEDALADIRVASARLQALAEALQDNPEDRDTLNEYGELLEWAQAHDLWGADRRRDLVLAGLGLGAVEHARPLDTLSGGQRSRLGLAALLIRQPGALLLDEPANHLDDRAAEFLETHLVRLPGVVVLASHDRVFLDAVCTDVVDLDPALDGPIRYGGAYSDYLLAKRARRARWEQQYAEEQRELSALRHAVRVTAPNIAHNREPSDNAKMAYDFKTGRVQKQISRRVRDARRRLDELEREQVPKPPPPLHFSGTLTGNAGGNEPVLSVRNLAVHGRVAVDELDISPDSRLLITGENGAGKSTLLNVLAGNLTADAGSVHRDRGIRVGLLEQDVEFTSPERTPLQLYAQTPARTPLADLGLLPPRDLTRPVGRLSVGQRRRLALALLVARTPQVLLLDEPTNHLSLSLAEELEEALHTAHGAVVVASHDRWLRRNWPGDELRLDGVRNHAVRTVG